MKRTTRIIVSYLCLGLGVARANLQDGPYTYAVTGGRATITGFDRAFSGALSITNNLGGHHVTSIGDRAFAWHTGLTSVTIPDSVIHIGDAAFSGCTSLTNILVGTENQNFTGVDGVLFNISATTLITYPAGRSGAYTIPNSVIHIGYRAFAGYANLTSVTIPNSVTHIGNWAFWGCFGLTSVTIPDSVTYIGDGAFHWCGSLQRVFFAGNAPSGGGACIPHHPIDDLLCAWRHGMGNNIRHTPYCPLESNLYGHDIGSRSAFLHDRRHAGYSDRHPGQDESFRWRVGTGR